MSNPKLNNLPLLAHYAPSRHIHKTNTKLGVRHLCGKCPGWGRGREGSGRGRGAATGRYLSCVRESKLSLQRLHSFLSWPLFDQDEGAQSPRGFVCLFVCFLLFFCGFFCLFVCLFVCFWFCGGGRCFTEDDSSEDR